MGDDWAVNALMGECCEADGRAVPLAAQPITRQRLVAVLVAHQRQTSAACLCGWSVLGASHPEHVADVILWEGEPGWLGSSTSGQGGPNRCRGQH